MFITDFEYNGLRLSSLNYMICDLSNGGGLTTVDNGSQITFHTTPILKGNTHVLVDTTYDQCVTATFQICKKPYCQSIGVPSNIGYGMSMDEVSTMMRWLNRRTFGKILFDADGLENITFEGSFNVQRVEFGGVTIALELTMITNRPYGLKKTQVHDGIIINPRGYMTFKNISDEIGFLYPTLVTITPRVASNNFYIINELEPDRQIAFGAVQQNEVITLRKPEITTTNSSHDIANQFNYNFLRLISNDDTNLNTFLSSDSCNIHIEYDPIKKMSI